MTVVICVKKFTAQVSPPISVGNFISLAHIYPNGFSNAWAYNIRKRAYPYKHHSPKTSPPYHESIICAIYPMKRMNWSSIENRNAKQSGNAVMAKICCFWMIMNE